MGPETKLLHFFAGYLNTSLVESPLRGFLLLESTDSRAMATFSSEWSDVCDLAVVPVNENAAQSEVLGGAEDTEEVEPWPGRPDYP